MFEGGGGRRLGMREGSSFGEGVVMGLVWFGGGYSALLSECSIGSR